jgi:hypothetical protein
VDVPVLVLWDLDNVTPGHNALPRLAAALAAAVGPACPVFAAGRAGAFDPVLENLTGLGITVLPGNRRRDGADGALLHLACTLAKPRDVRHIVVLSNDRAFAALPKRAAVSVLTLSPDSVSGCLRARALSVQAIGVDGEGFVLPDVFGIAGARGSEARREHLSPEDVPILGPREHVSEHLSSPGPQVVSG